MQTWLSNNRTTSTGIRGSKGNTRQGKTWGNFWAKENSKIVAEEMVRLGKNTDEIGGRKTAVANCIGRLSEQEKDEWQEKFQALLEAEPSAAEQAK